MVSSEVTSDGQKTLHDKHVKNSRGPRSEDFGVYSRYYEKSTENPFLIDR